ncbi:MAG: hemerythrin domain-containing protein [Syntrophobacteraceae bacterium]
MFSKNFLSRRKFFILAGATGAGLLEGCSRSSQPTESVCTAIEALELQHGLTRRVLAVMENIKNGLNAQSDISPEIAGGALEIISDFMINCHQLMEEKFIFPLFASYTKTSELIGVLRKQHAAAYKLTYILKPLCLDLSQKNQENRRKAVNMIHLLTRMSFAHQSWEDTALFPLLRVVAPGRAYEDLGSQFAQEQNQFLGRDSIEQTIQKIAYYEKSLGLGNLDVFTPRPEDLS